MAMKCPHCEVDIENVTRTGDKRYSCGECSMVISYDDIEPYLDDLNVDDKREEMKSSSSQSQQQGGNNQQQQSQEVPANSGPSNRELIYQRGLDGLKEIKKKRLKNWLSKTDGVGNQTEQRILMVFERNESVHKNPHVLYNLLDDELGASPSYLNTLVDDVFAPEEEHADILENQGYTPWYNRRHAGGSQAPQPSGGMSMGAGGASGFSPGQSRGGGQMQSQQGQQQGGGGGSQNADYLTKDDAAMMMSQAVDQADNERERRALVEGLSDATDEALREMATNVGGLAGTVQRVIDEALVQYARENPEWVIENMGILQKVIGATQDVEQESSSQQSTEPEQDMRVDEAVSNIQSGGAQQEQDEKPNPDLDDVHLEESDYQPRQPVEHQQEDTSEEETQEGSLEQIASTGVSQPDEPMNDRPPDDAVKDADEPSQELGEDNIVEEDDESEEDSFEEIFGD